jgi:hypothetical protein
MQKMVAMLIAVASLAACDRVPGTQEWRVRRDVSKALIDPASARIEITHKAGSTICGTVNGKNRMGAYAGSTPFIWEEILGTHIYDEPDMSDVRSMGYGSETERMEHANKIGDGCFFAEKWAKQCAGSVHIDEQLCKLWQAGDMATLSSIAKGY